MKIGQLEKKFGVSGTTIRRWIEAFSDFLSPESQKIDLHQRIFTESDYIILASINSLSKQGDPFIRIREKLEAGYRIEEDDIASIGYSDGRMVPAVVVEQVIDSSKIRSQLEEIRQERDRLLEILEKTQGELRNLKDQYEQNEKMLRQEMKEEEAELRQEIRRLEETARQREDNIRQEIKLLEEAARQREEAIHKENKELLRALGKAEGKLEEIYENRKLKGNEG